MVAEFTSPQPRTIVMRIVDGEGTGSVVETHATPVGPGADRRPRTADWKRSSLTRTGPASSKRARPRLITPLMRQTATRPWRDDLAYASAATSCAPAASGLNSAITGDPFYKTSTSAYPHPEDVLIWANHDPYVRAGRTDNRDLCAQAASRVERGFTPALAAAGTSSNCVATRRRWPPARAIGSRAHAGRDAPP